MAPPVACDKGGAAPIPNRLSIEVILPADTHEITWRLTLEDGAERTERTAFKQLELVDGRNFEKTVLERRRLLLEGDLPWGYHRLAIEPGDASMTLVVTPGQCWMPHRWPRAGDCGALPRSSICCARRPTGASETFVICVGWWNWQPTAAPMSSG